MSGPMSASDRSAGSRPCRFFTRSSPLSLTSRVAVSLKVPSFSSAVVRLGRSLISTSIAGGISLQRPVDHLALVRECAGDAVQLLDGLDDVVALGIQRSDEIVEPGEQLADLRLASRHGGTEVVDDVADLAQPAAR